MENLGLIIAIVGTGMTMVGVLFGVIFWTRGEANALRSEANDDRRDIVNLIVAIKEDGQNFRMEMAQESQNFRREMAQESQNFRREMAQESKDFHGRLCITEERRR